MMKLSQIVAALVVIACVTQGAVAHNHHAPPSHPPPHPPPVPPPHAPPPYHGRKLQGFNSKVNKMAAATNRQADRRSLLSYFY